MKDMSHQAQELRHRRGFIALVLTLTALLGRTMRSDGRLQVTYNRHPLYTFALDKQPHQTRGEGNLAFGARWWAVSARGTKVGKPATTTTTTTTTGCAYPPCP